jgi:hypothetical protein
VRQQGWLTNDNPSQRSFNLDAPFPPYSLTSPDQLLEPFNATRDRELGAGASPRQQGGGREGGWVRQQGWLTNDNPTASHNTTQWWSSSRNRADVRLVDSTQCQER